MRALLAYDGSDGAGVAASLAESIAWPRDSVIRVITVFEPIEMQIPGPWARGAVVGPEVDAAIATQLSELNSQLVGHLRGPHRSVEGAVVRGRPGSAIVDEARAFDADLVLIGSRGHGSIASLLLGSVSSEVVDHAPCPVLVARASTVTVVVFATDESASSLAAETILAEWPTFERVPIRVVSVADVAYPWRTGVAPTMYRQVLEAYADDLRDAKEAHQRIAVQASARLVQAGRRAEVEVREGDVAAEILAVADERQADLIVLGSRGRSGLTRVVLGSVARNVLSSSGASVLIVREHTLEAPAGGPVASS